MPTSVSAQARERLSMTSPFERSVYPDLDDLDGWLALVDERNRHIAEVFAGVEMPSATEAIDVDGVTTYVICPDGVDDATAPICVDIHGGALIAGGGILSRSMAVNSAQRTGMLTWAPDYRMPPRFPYPAGLDDCLAVYRAALAQRVPEQIVVGGSSAGGNLAAAMLLRARDEGLPMPGALVLLTPEVDLTESGDTFRTNLGLDNVLGLLMPVNLLYADGEDLTHPYLSPLFGDLTGFPPTMLQAGTRDLFLSNTVRMHRKLRSCGVDAELHVFEAMPHGGFGGAPEDVELTEELRRFLARRLG
jgi:acetyl esterase/lipase